MLWFILPALQASLSLLLQNIFKYIQMKEQVTNRRTEDDRIEKIEEWGYSLHLMI